MILDSKENKNDCSYNKIQHKNNSSVIGELYQDVVGTLFAGMIVVLTSTILVFLCINSLYIAIFNDILENKSLISSSSIQKAQNDAPPKKNYPEIIQKISNLFHSPSLIMEQNKSTSQQDEIQKSKGTFDILKAFSNFHIEISILFISISFVVGTVLSRQEINIPSYISAFENYINLEHKSGICIKKILKGETLLRLRYKFGIVALYAVKRHRYTFDCCKDKCTDLMQKSSKYKSVNYQKVKENPTSHYHVDKFSGYDNYKKKNEYKKSEGNKKLSFLFIKIMLKKIKDIICYAIYRFNRYRNAEEYYFLVQEAINSTFPFPGMKCYLVNKKLYELADYITWCPKKKKSLAACGKEFINDIKVRIFLEIPSAYRHLDRVETQIKLVNTAWYSLRFIVLIAFSCLIFTIVLFIFSLVYMSKYEITSILLKSIYWNFFSSSLALLICAKANYSTVKIIHPLRIREIVTILSYRNYLS